MPRPIDIAMGEDRPEKRVIRELWLEKAAELDQEFPDDQVPLYLTLSGAEGRDIELFAQKNLIELTEVGGIAEESQKRVVAVERNATAVLTLQRKYPGLKILEQDLQNLLRGGNPIRYPESREDVRCFRARIVNLDFDISLGVREHHGNFDHPVLIWVEKICQIHTGLSNTQPRLDWCLFLTLNANISWPERASNKAIRLVQDNFGLSPDFEAQCREVLGDEFHQEMISDGTLDLSSDALSNDIRQKFLMTFVPKKIAQIVYAKGWRVKTVRNLRYGGQGGQAPMVTWMFAFIGDDSAPNEAYRENLQGILSSAGYVTENGEIEPFR